MYRQSKWVRAVAGLGLWALVMLVVPGVLGLPLAVGHAQYHAIFALGVLAPAAFIVLRRGHQPTIASNAPVAGLLALAAAQLVESVGGLGYGPDNDGRVNGLVVFHDIGLGLVGLGLAAAVIGIAIGIAVLARRRFGRSAAVALGAALLVAGSFGVSKLLGF